MNCHVPQQRSLVNTATPRMTYLVPRSTVIHGVGSTIKPSIRHLLWKQLPLENLLLRLPLTAKAAVLAYINDD